METSIPKIATLQPADLADLGYWLRERGFIVAPDQLIAAAQLLALQLLSGQGALPERAQLAPYLAPIFCSSSEMQARFGAVYTDWVQLRWPQQKVAVVQADAPHALAENTVSKLARPVMQGWRAVVLGLGLVLLVALALAWYWKTHPAIVPPIVQPSASVSASASAAAQAMPPELIQKTRQVEISEAANYFHPIDLFGPLAVAGITLAWWLFTTLRRRGFLLRLPSDGTPSDTRWLAALVNDVRRLGAGLRRRINVDSRELDVAASIRASVRRGGYFTPVFGSRVEPEYLILVDKASHGDHLAHLAEEMLAALEWQGVVFERYEFDADPRRLRHAPLRGGVLHAGPQSLPQLHSRHTDARLIIVSDGQGLIDPYSGRVASCLPLLTAWQAPVLLTPQIGRLWSVREWLLGHAGLVLLPLNGSGLTILGQLFETEKWQSLHNDEAKTRPRPVYWQDQDMWLDRVAPPAATRDKLLDALVKDLGADGMAWLSACAVYPEINWGITLMLGNALLAPVAPVAKAALPWQLPHRERYAECLTQLARLPWLRVGFMPNWLRSALLNEQLPECGGVVRRALDAFFEQASQASKPYADALAVALAQKAGKGRVGLPDAAQDKVFLRFMSGRAQPLAFGLGERLLRLLYPDGTPLAGPRGVVLVAGLALAVGWVAVRPPVGVELVSKLTEVQDGVKPEKCKYCPEMVRIPAGRFIMGDDKSDQKDERPAHKVTIVKPFAMGKYAVTQGQWRAVMGNNPSRFKDCGDTCPVERVSWNDAQAYLKKLNEMSGLQYRLPSEAEWEYAARAGSTTAYPWGDKASHEYANYGKDTCCGGMAEGRDKWVNTSPVGSFPPNAFGLYDMHGNVWQWVEDSWHSDYKGAPQDGSVWVIVGKNENRVLRGGSWNDTPSNLRSAYRFISTPAYRFNYSGLRVARTLP